MGRFVKRLLVIIGLAGLGAVGYRRVTGRKPDDLAEPSGAAQWAPLQPAQKSQPPQPISTAPVEAPAPRWVEPRDGTCPDTHPIKANADSGIFHVPGGRSYGTTKAERCYCDSAHAEADGFRAAKR